MLIQCRSRMKTITRSAVRRRRTLRSLCRSVYPRRRRELGGRCRAPRKLRGARPLARLPLRRAELRYEPLEGAPNFFLIPAVRVRVELLEPALNDFPRLGVERAHENLRVAGLRRVLRRKRE